MYGRLGTTRSGAGRLSRGDDVEDNASGSGHSGVFRSRLLEVHDTRLRSGLPSGSAHWNSSTSARDLLDRAASPDRSADELVGELKRIRSWQRRSRSPDVLDTDSEERDSIDCIGEQCFQDPVSDGRRFSAHTTAQDDVPSKCYRIIQSFIKRQEGDRIDPVLLLYAGFYYNALKRFLIFRGGRIWDMSSSFLGVFPGFTLACDIVHTEDAFVELTDPYVKGAHGYTADFRMYLDFFRVAAMRVFRAEKAYAFPRERGTSASALYIMHSIASHNPSIFGSRLQSEKTHRMQFLLHSRFRACLVSKALAQVFDRLPSYDHDAKNDWLGICELPYAFRCIGGLTEGIKCVARVLAVERLSGREIKNMLDAASPTETYMITAMVLVAGFAETNVYKVMRASGLDGMMRGHIGRCGGHDKARMLHRRSDSEDRVHLAGVVREIMCILGNTSLTPQNSYQDHVLALLRSRTGLRAFFSHCLVYEMAKISLVGRERLNAATGDTGLEPGETRCTMLQAIGEGVSPDLFHERVELLLKHRVIRDISEEGQGTKRQGAQRCSFR
ncbi:MAG: hypothetical protein ACTJLL_02495 [Anaplasma sp.]